MQPLAGILVVDLTRYLPGAYASRELLRLGARVVRVEAPGGDPMRETAPAWDAALRAGTESVVCDLKADPALAARSLARADVVLESFRPGVAARLGVGPERRPGVGRLLLDHRLRGDGRHVARAGHDLNYLGWAGVLADTAPAWPPVQVADLAAGSLGAVVADPRGAARTRPVGARRTRRGLDDARLARPRRPPPRRRSRAAIAHGRARLLPHLRDRGRPAPDGRRARAEVLRAALRASSGDPSSAERQYADDQEALAAELAAIFARALARRLA